jgi:long-chain acyl-CoA synthetase
MFLCLQNVPEFVIALLGAARAGVVTVPLNPMYRLPEIEKLAADCGPRAIVCETDHAETVLGAALPGVHRFTVGEGGTFGVAQAGPAGVDTPCDPLMIVYTSGTTGKPKGAVVSHANLLAGAQTYCETAAAGHPHSGGSPLFHVTGLSGHIGRHWRRGRRWCCVTDFRRTRFWMPLNAIDRPLRWRRSPRWRR